MDRRSLLKGATALAGIPIIGRYVIDNPTLVSGISAPSLLVPEKEPLVITSEMPARSVSGFTIWPSRFDVELSQSSYPLSEWVSHQRHYIPGPRTAQMRLDGILTNPDDMRILGDALRSGRRLRIYVEPESG